MKHVYFITDGENNSTASVASFETLQSNSVRQFLSEQEMSKIPTNGHTVDSLSQLSSMNRRDSIDKFGIATKLLSQSAAKYSASGFRQKLYNQQHFKH